MLIKDNPITAQLHEDWRQRIVNRFTNIDFSDCSDFLCLISYLDNSPQKFYSERAFSQYFDSLNSLKANDPKLLADILKEAEPILNISNKILSNVNEKHIHDILLPKDHNDLISFIDKEIHYNLLKIYETPFFQFCQIIAKYYWLKAKKGTDGLDLYNSVEQLKKEGFDFISSIYLHDVRNGIAHGKIIFSDLDITYIDKKNNKTKIPTRKIIDTLDGTLDVVNGFCLAFKTFCFTNSAYFEKFKIPIPQSILLEELQAKANAPAWKITNCLESVALNNKRQLMIYAQNDNWDFFKVSWHCFTTAYWAEALTKSYDRIFFSLSSTHAKISPSGWAAYDAGKFRTLRERNEMRIEEYKGVLEGDIVFFVPKIKFPKFVYRIGTLHAALKISFPLAWSKYKNTYFPKLFTVRDTQIHSRAGHSIINDPSVVINAKYQSDIQQLIRTKKRKILKEAIKYSRKQCSWFSLTRYLPVKYIRISIYDTDMRIRNLRNSGLISELVATIEVNKTKQIKTIDIIGGKVEQLGIYRIVWNKKWIEKKAAANTGS